MIRIDRQEPDISAAPAHVGTPHRRFGRAGAERFVETEYFCGCKSTDPHATDHCQIHGDSIRLTRIIRADAPIFG